MEISLNDATSARIQKLVESGAYSSADEVVDTALALLDERDYVDDLNEDEIADIRERAQRGAAQADRGEVTPADVVFDRLEKRYTEMLKQKE